LSPDAGNQDRIDNPSGSLTSCFATPCRNFNNIYQGYLFHIAYRLS
jgi:hypothetical protein